MFMQLGDQFPPPPSWMSSLSLPPHSLPSPLDTYSLNPSGLCPAVPHLLQTGGEEQELASTPKAQKVGYTEQFLTHSWFNSSRARTQLSLSSTAPRKQGLLILISRQSPALRWKHRAPAADRRRIRFSRLGPILRHLNLIGCGAHHCSLPEVCLSEPWVKLQ